MELRKLGNTPLEIGPLVLGGNVFGWTIDEKTSFQILDAFVDAGLNAVDTADIYSKWVPGNQGGESESILGRWFRRSPSNRQKTVLITKVGSEFSPERRGLSERWILQAAEDSLRRLGTDHIDLYLSHWPDATVPYEETLGAYEKLLRAGKVRAIGASNLSAIQLDEALKAARQAGLPRYEVLQPEYNLYARDSFEGPLQDLTVKEGLGVVPYFSLASGFLTGKYRSEKDFGKSARGSGMAKYLNERGLRILAALDQVAQETGSVPAEVALAWLGSRRGITAPIASATTIAQLQSLVKAAQLKLTAGQTDALERASQL
jgi:aryl-alcohol dehydrogenase-like predicted oxidoreductase